MRLAGSRTAGGRDARSDGEGRVRDGIGSGIGEGSALALARAGADVACTDVDLERAEATAAQVRAIGREALAAAVDVRDFGALEEAVAATAAQLGRLDIVVANAGIARGSNVLTLTEGDLDTVFDVNTKGVFLTVKACAREMVREGRAGRVVVISSVSGERAEMGSSAYCGSKAAVRMMTRCWALDLAPFGITVNSIAPGMTETRLWGAVAARQRRARDAGAGAPLRARGPAGGHREPRLLARQRRSRVHDRQLQRDGRRPARWARSDEPRPAGAHHRDTGSGSVRGRRVSAGVVGRAGGGGCGARRRAAASGTGCSSG